MGPPGTLNLWGLDGAISEQKKLYKISGKFVAIRIVARPVVITIVFYHQLQFNKIIFQNMTTDKQNKKIGLKTVDGDIIVRFIELW